MEIVYCGRCGVRVPDKDLATGVAAQGAQGQCFCVECAHALRQARTSAKLPARPATREAAAARAGRATTGAARPAAAGVAGTEDVPAPKGRGKLILAAGVGLGVCGLVLIVVAASHGGGKAGPSGSGTPPVRGRVAAAASSATREAENPAQSARQEPAAQKAGGRDIPVPPAAPQAGQETSISAPAEPAKTAPAPAEAIDDIRESFARRKWAEIKAAGEDSPAEAWSKHRQLVRFASTYASTAAGKEAAEFLKQQTRPAQPPLSAGKAVSASSIWNEPGYEAEKAFDDDESTRWNTAPNLRSGWIEVDLGQEMQIGEAVIKELSLPRTRQFAVECKRGDNWEELARGTTIAGEKRLLFGPVTARHVRLNILQADAEPTVEEFMLFAPSAPK